LRRTSDFKSFRSPVVKNVYESLVRNHRFKFRGSKQRDHLAKLDKNVKSQVF